MCRKLNEKEMQWISFLMNVEFQGKDILLKQFEKADVIYEEEYDFISIKFKIGGKTELYPYHVRVPVEMRAFQQPSVPIVFLLHVVNGLIDELEIITADSTQIDANNIILEKVKYEINKEVVVKR